MLAVWALSVMAQALDPVTYIDYVPDGDGIKQSIGQVTKYTLVDSNTVAWNAGNYVVSGDVTINGRITVGGNVNLILKDGATLKANQGITVHNGSILTIYAQSEDEDTMGRIVIPGNLKDNAGIGGVFSGDPSERACGIVTFNGGRISFTQGESGSVSERKAAGIGGARDGGGGAITVNGGIIEDIKRYEGACIGGGWNSPGGTFVINGGTIRNLASEYGACIGGGRGYADGAITINGGTIENIANSYGAAIGGGYNALGREIKINGGSITIVEGDYDSVSGAGIGGGDGKEGKNITITGGTININQSGKNNRTGAAIGGGQGGEAKNITIRGGEIHAKTAAAPAIGSPKDSTFKVTVAPVEGEMIRAKNGSSEIGSYYENESVQQWDKNELTLETEDNGFKTVSIDTAPQTKTMIDPALSFEVKPTPASLGSFTVKYKTGEQAYSETVPTGVGTYDVRVSRAQTISRNTDNSVNLENSFKRFTLEIPGGLKIIKADRSAPVPGTDFTAGNETYMGLGDGWLQPEGAEKLEYRLQGAADFAALDSRADGLAPGTYEVRFAETDIYNASAVATVNVLASTQKTDVQLVREALGALPDSVEPDDVDTVTAIRNAQKLFLALGAQERGQIEQQLVEKLNALIADAFRYAIVEGDGASVMAASKRALRFVANGPAQWLQAVKVDGSVLAQNRYTVESGSTIVTLHDDYVASLPAGEHNLTLVYNDGSVSAQFSVLAALDLPQTGDHSGLAQWAALTLLCAGGVIAMLARRKRA